MTLDPRDRILQSATPLIPVPHYGGLEPLDVGRKRFLAAADGVYLEARTSALHACVNVAPGELPFGPLQSHVTFPHGPLPAGLLRDFMRAAVEASPNEIAAVLHASADGYAWQEIATESASPVHVRYDDRVVDPDRLALDCHSHGRGIPTFSFTDDESDLARPGPHLSLVVGYCTSEAEQRVSLRLCCAPYLVELPLSALRDLVREGVTT